MSTLSVGPVRRVGKTRNPWGVWVLGLVTFGIYHLWWYYKINSEVRDFDPGVHVQPGISVVALLFGGVLCGIPVIVTVINTGGRISQAQQTAGSADRCSGLIGLLFALISVMPVYYQSQLNKVWDMYNNPPEGTVV